MDYRDTVLNYIYPRNAALRKKIDTGGEGGVSSRKPKIFFFFLNCFRKFNTKAKGDAN